jgi:Flp pilus assembly pilin Flp
VIQVILRRRQDVVDWYTNRLIDRNRERGATTLEYVIIAAIVCAAAIVLAGIVVAAITRYGNGIKDMGP